MSIYQLHKDTIDWINAALKNADIGYTYKSYNKWTITFWNVDCGYEELLRFALDLLNKDGVHEAKVIVRMRNCSTPKEFHYGSFILRLTVEFYRELHKGTWVA